MYKVLYYDIYAEYYQSIKQYQQASAYLDAMRLKYEQVQATIRETGENIRKLTAELNASNKSAAQQKAIYAQIQANVQKLEQAAAKSLGASKRIQQCYAGIAVRHVASSNRVYRNSSLRTGANSFGNNARGEGAGGICPQSRLAMSWTQRLRGEVLALATSYAGVFGALQLARSAVDAFTTLEGATSRLNVVFDGDKSAVAQNLEMVRRTADRLGLSFGVWPTSIRSWPRP